MGKWKQLFLLPFVLLMCGCSYPAISDVRTEVVDRNPANYRTVSKTRVEIETEYNLEDDLLNQNFWEVKVTYLDSDNNSITQEVTQTLKQAIDRNKRGATLVTGGGKGTNITYTAKTDEGSENRTYNVPFVADLKGFTLRNEYDLYQVLFDLEPRLTYTWTGNTDNVVDEIIIRNKKKEYDYMPDYNIATEVWETRYIPYYLVTEYTYTFDKTLQLLNKTEYRED